VSSTFRFCHGESPETDLCRTGDIRMIGQTVDLKAPILDGAGSDMDLLITNTRACASDPGPFDT